MRQLIFILLLLPFLSYSQSEGGFGFRRFANKTNLDATSVNNSDKSASRRAYVHSTGLYYIWEGTRWVEEFGYDRYFSVKKNMPFNSYDPYLAFVDLQNYYSGRVGVIRVDTTVLIPDDVTVNTSIEFIGEGNLDVSSSKEIVFNSYIIAEPEQYIFTGDGDYTFNQRIEQLYPTWFGANELNADNYAQFQKTIDAAITSDILQVKVPGGAYTLSQGLLIRNGSDIVTLNFSGNSNYDGDAGTTLIFTDTTTFGIAIQGARNVHISNLYIRGKQNSFNPTLAQLITIPESTYDNNLGRNSRYSPYSGIVIDPFRNGTPADGGYPGFTSQYSNTHATSSNIKISDVVIRYFIGGITTSPSGFEGNGAEISIEDCVIDRNMFGICTGSSQNRDVQITGTSLSFCKYGMTGLKFGAQNGAMPIFSNGQISYAKAMLEYNATIGNGKIANTYSESLWSIGRWVGRGAPLSFTNTEIKFALDTETGVADAPCVLTSRETPFVMEGGSLFYTNYRPVNMVAISVLLKGTFINRPILNLMSNSPNEDAVEYRAVRLNGYNNSLSDYRVNQDVDAVDYRNTRNVVVLKNGKITYRESNGTTSLYSTHPENVVVYTQATQNKQATITLETKTVTIDTTLRTGTFTTSFPGKYRVGDILGFATNTRTPDGGLTFSDIGIVSSIVGGTVTTSHVPMGVTTGSIQLELYELPRFTGTWRGNIQSGTNKLIVTSKPLTTGGDSAAVRWPVGMRVYSKQATRTSTGIPRGTYVTSVLKDTIYLSNTTDTTYNEIEFFNADLKGTYYSTDGTYPTSADTLRSVSFQRGDEIYFIGHAYRRKATVTLGGFTPTLSFIYKTLYGLDANKPTPTSADIGLTYFSTDSSKLKIWTGTTWIGVGGGSSVNIGNSDLTTDDNLRTLTLQDDFQIIGDGASPSTYIEMGSLAGGRALINNSQSALYYSDLGGINQFFANTNGIQITTPLTSSRSILFQADSIIEQGAVNGELYKFYPDPTYIYPVDFYSVQGQSSVGDYEVYWGSSATGQGSFVIGGSNGNVNIGTDKTGDGNASVGITSDGNPSVTLLSTPSGEWPNAFAIEHNFIYLDTESGDPFVINAPVEFSNIITPADITTSVNDYNPTDLDDAHGLALTSTANVNITGLTSTGFTLGRQIIIFNRGNFNITLVNESASSSAANRFSLPNNHVIPAKGSVILEYLTGSINRWVIASGSSTLNVFGSSNQMLGINNAGTAYEWKTFLGTTNQVTITDGVGTKTWSLPQDIHTAATPTFSDLTLTDDLFVTDDVLIGSGNSISTITMNASSINGITINNAGQLTVGSTSGNLTLNSGGVGGTATYSASSSGYSEQLYALNTSGTSTTLNGVRVDHIQNDGSALDAGHFISVTRFQSRGVSAAIQSGAQIIVRADQTWTNTSIPTDIAFYTVPTGSSVLSERLVVNAGGELDLLSGNPFRLFDSNNSNHYRIKAPANDSLTSNLAWVLPRTTGTNGQVLKIRSDSLLYWANDNSGGGGNGIYGGDGNIPAGGSQVLMDTIGETVRFVMNTGNTTLREMLRLETVENAFTRFFVLKGPSDSLRVFRASAGRQYTFQTYGGTAFQIASDSIISFLADSILYVESSVESKSKMRYLMGLSVNNYVKRFDANPIQNGDFLISDGTDWGISSDLADGSILIGNAAAKSSVNQIAHSSGRFASDGDAQSSEFVIRREITGQAETELFLDGSSLQMILPSNKVWTGTYSCNAVATTVGNGTVVQGDVYAQWQPITIKRIGSSTSLVTGSGLVIEAWNDATMYDALFNVTADNTNEALKITFIPPSTAGTTTVCRAVCTVRVTEVGY